MGTDARAFLGAQRQQLHRLTGLQTFSGSQSACQQELLDELVELADVPADARTQLALIVTDDTAWMLGIVFDGVANAR